MTEDTPQNDTSCPLGTNDCPIYEEIASLKEEVNALKDQVRTDHMTGLYNKLHMNASLEQEMERTQRSQQATTFILLDIDHFKNFNDTHGHIAGDHVLTHVARLLKRAVRKIDIPCRYGGEEFGIILPSTPMLVGSQVAERIRSAIEQTPLFFEGQEFSITASFGVDSFTYNTRESVEDFIARADAQLYKAKENGRNQVCHAIHKLESAAQVSESEKDALFNLLNDE